MKRRYILILAALLCGMSKISAQGFFNLTAEEVRIDSLLPCFTYTHDLGRNYADSVYDVTIDYPEFIPMTDTDIRRYHRITADSLPALPVVNSYVAVARKRGQLDVAFVPLVCRDGRFMKLVSFKLTITARPKTTSDSRMKGLSDSRLKGFSGAGNAPAADKYRAANADNSPASRYADHSVLRSGRWAKIRVAHSGIFQLTNSLITNAGFSDPSRVKLYGYGGAIQPETLSGSYLTATDDLCEVPTCVVDGKRLFYAQGPVTWSASNDRVRNPYSDYGYYFLTESDGEPLTVDEQTFTDSFYPAGEHSNTLYEVDDFAWYHSGRNLYDSRQFTSGVSRDYDVASAGTSVDGTVLVVASADSRTLVSVSVNDSVVGTITISSPVSNSVANIGRSVFRVGNLQPSNKITISHTSGGTARLDYIVVHNNVCAAAPDLHATAFPTPEYVYNITNQDHHADTPTDMIILLPTTQKLRAQAERLKELREKNDGMSVRIVPVDELYNEFSSGTPDATAYRRYLKMFYDRAETDADIPKYLVLFGDGVWDNRMRLTAWQNCSPDDFLLCFESENSYSTTASYVSDDFFCMLDDGEAIQTGESTNRGKADVAVGRFPVRTEEEAQTMVDKLVNYVSNAYAGPWQSTIVFLGDDGDNNLHMKAANKVADDIISRYPTLDVRKIMWDTYLRQASATGFSYPDVENIVKQYMTNGALVINYSGHGAPTTISHELVLRINDFKTTVSNNLPLWITASCDIMPFDTQEENIGETALFNKSGGAVAFLGTTRTVFASYNEPTNLAIMREVLNVADGKPTPIGEALRLAKNSLVDGTVSTTNSDGSPAQLGDKTSNKLHYTLLGDPSLRLAIPLLDVVIDSINDVKPSETPAGIQLKAGMPVVVKGHIEDGGTRQTDFDGLLTATVRDAEELIKGRLNDRTADEPISYYDRLSTLYKGTDSIRGGEFTFRFVVPTDINYTDKSGQLLTYAVSADKKRTARGADESFVLNGSIDFGGGTAGPSIYCYLNSPSFVNGGKVNPTPYFVAELSDDDGINSTGSGIGHSMQLVVDGEMSRTYELNDYFTFDFGTYKSGSVGYRIPQLPAGEHRLQFRAWDVFNNSTTAELTFNVVDDLEPVLFDVDCTKNPAVTSTSFRILHDRIGSNLDIMIDIFDMSGRHLWTYTEQGTATANTTTIDWDLTVDGGNRLGTGVYLYRVRVSSEGSGYVSKAKKLIILSNK